jgi:hypothetical protein
MRTGIGRMRYDFGRLFGQCGLQLRLFGQHGLRLVELFVAKQHLGHLGFGRLWHVGHWQFFVQLDAGQQLLNDHAWQLSRQHPARQLHYR